MRNYHFTQHFDNPISLPQPLSPIYLHNDCTFFKAHPLVFLCFTTYPCDFLGKNTEYTLPLDLRESESNCRSVASALEADFLFIAVVLVELLVIRLCNSMDCKQYSSLFSQIFPVFSSIGQFWSCYVFFFAFNISSSGISMS